MVVGILLVEHFFQEEFGLLSEITNDLVIVTRRDQLLEVIEDGDTAAWIVGVVDLLEDLDLHKEGQELVETWHVIDVNLQQGLQRLLTLSELVHCAVVDRVTARNAVLVC